MVIPYYVIMDVLLSKIDGTDVRFKFRTDFPEEEVKRLAASMARTGLLNRVKLWKIDERYIIIAGWERVHAAEYNNWETIPADVYEGISLEQAFEINMADNVIRSSLSEMELSNQISRFRYVLEKNVEDIAKIYGWNKQRVYDLLTVQKVKPEIQDALHKGEINLSGAIALSKMPESRQVNILNKSVKEDWSHRRYTLELRYWKSYPFNITYTKEDLEKLEGRYHAFPYVRHPETVSLIKKYREVFKLQPGIHRCCFTETVPAKNFDVACPRDIEWVVVSPHIIEPTFSVEIIDEENVRCEHIYLCDECTRLLFPNAEFHTEVEFPPKTFEIDEDFIIEYLGTKKIFQGLKPYKAIKK
jgi:ParB/RepB/Spo0J family partition protein